MLVEQMEWLVREHFQNDMDWYHLKQFLYQRLQEDDVDEKNQMQDHLLHGEKIWSEVPFQTLVHYYCDYLMAAPQEAHAFDAYIDKLLAK